MEPFVSVDWLAARIADVKVADVRWYLDGRSGRASYDAGHIPGAVFVDLERWLAAHAISGGGRHPLPDPEVFAEGMSLAGISDDDTVVAYDDAGGVIASRLAWMLRAIGRKGAVLDGGIAAWHGGLSKEAAAPQRAIFTATPWPAAGLATIDDARNAANLVLDARDLDRYRGDTEPIDPRAGHIPGARSLPCRTNLDRDGTLLPLAELQERIRAVGVVDASNVVSYCGSGVTACHNLLVLEHAGFGTARLFPGSWSEYSRREDLPVATGEQP